MIDHIDKAAQSAGPDPVASSWKMSIISTYSSSAFHKIV